MSSEAKPYTKEEAAELGTSHYGASAARVRATVAERDSLRAHVAKLQLDVSGLKGTIRENYDAHVLVQAERDSLRSQRDAARKELGDVLENLDLKSLNSALDEVRAQASEFSLALALEKVARAKAELERDALAEALETLRLVVGPESEDEMYGAFHGGDPRDFTPDPECSTEAERSAHAVACKKAEESGAARLLPDTHSFERLGEDAAVHIARAGFGLGTTVFRNEALCEAMDIIGAALLRVKP